MAALVAPTSRQRLVSSDKATISLGELTLVLQLNLVYPFDWCGGV